MLLVGFYFVEVEVNKQQLIDKAIDDLRLAEEDPFFGKKFLCRTPLADGRFAYYGTDYPHHMADLVCAKHEFQARKAEREAQQHWYDYENQKALRFPPVGEVCLVNEYDKVEIVGETNDGYKVYKYIDTGFFGMACQITSYKPLDWDGGLKSIIIKSCDITDYDASILTATLLAAGYRKCDNNDPTTQE